MVYKNLCFKKMSKFIKLNPRSGRKKEGETGYFNKNRHFSRKVKSLRGKPLSRELMNARRKSVFLPKNPRISFHQIILKKAKIS